MQGQRQSIKVLVRVRPTSKKQEEIVDSYQHFCKGKKKTNQKGKGAQAALNFFTKYHNVNPKQVMQLSNTSVSVCDQQYKNTQKKMRDYNFSQVFGPDITNHDIFDRTIKQELEGVFQGINCTLFAYGITGSGKTFSVFGQKSQKGISFLAFNHIFKKKRELEAIGANVQVKFSFIEIYNQNVKDLLSEDSKKNISIGEEKGVVTLVDSTEICISSVEDILQLISIGSAKRTSATTQSNLISSRSHAILKLNIETTYKGHHTTSKLYIIDLAGSQKLSTENGQRKNQGSNINKSLLTLGNCINALVQNSKKQGSAHIPYRDSKLTRLLKDSLGGTARTIMIACISAYPFTLDQTITTLNYAERAQGIRKEVSKNVKIVEYDCPRCKDLMNSVSPQKIQSQPMQDISLWQSPQTNPNGLESGIFMQICQKLYQDILQNAKQTQQIQRLRADIQQPCEQFNLILNDNQEQRLHLKQVLFNLLNEKQRIVVKESQIKGYDKKKIRLSSSAKRCRERTFEKQERQHHKQYEKKDEFCIMEDNLNEFEVGMSTPFHSQEQSNSTTQKPPGQEKTNHIQNVEPQTEKKRKRSKFEIVPRPSSMKKSTENVLCQANPNQQNIQP